MSESSGFRALIADMQRMAEEADGREADARGITVDALRAAREAEDRARLADADKRRERERRQSIVDTYGSRMPSHAADAFVAGSLRPTKALEETRRYLGSSTAFLVLSGGTGAGKTMSALWALSELSGVLVRSPDLGPSLDPWKGDPDRIVPFTASWPALVVLDDLGTERTEDARWATAFDELIDARQGCQRGQQLRTIITTNLTPEQIKARYSERARSRIRASCQTVILSTSDMRGAK